MLMEIDRVTTYYAQSIEKPDIAMLVSSKTRLFQKVGFLAALLGVDFDRFFFGTDDINQRISRSQR
jgi:hypothetical protein